MTVRIPEEPMYSRRTLRFIVESLSYIFGGTTISEDRGTWVDSEGQLVYNKVWTVEAFDTMNREAQEIGWEMYELAYGANEILQEDTVMYTINDEAYFT